MKDTRKEEKVQVNNNKKAPSCESAREPFFSVISRQACVLSFDDGNKFYDIATLSSCFIRLGDCLFEIVMKYLLYRAIRISGDN